MVLQSGHQNPDTMVLSLNPVGSDSSSTRQVLKVVCNIPLAGAWELGTLSKLQEQYNARLEQCTNLSIKELSSGCIVLLTQFVGVHDQS
jgi:hypothetical protein